MILRTKGNMAYDFDRKNRQREKACKGFVEREKEKTNVLRNNQ